jgi:membrane protein YdbS with pleckstrin-like domain
MEYNKLNNNATKSWFIARAITTIIVSAILIGGKYFITIKFSAFKGKAGFYVNIVIVVIILFLLLNAIIYPKIEYKQWRYLINEDKIEFSEGIYYINTVVIPIVRVQHIMVSQGPINKRFNLADIHIYTAGGSHKIPNIEMEKAEEISNFLKDKIKEKVMEDDR